MKASVYLIINNKGQSLVLFLVLLPIFMSCLACICLSYHILIRWQELHFYSCNPALKIQYEFKKSIKVLLNINKKIRLLRKLKKTAHLILATSTNPQQLHLAVQSLKKIKQQEKYILAQQKLLFSSNKMRLLKIKTQTKNKIYKHLNTSVKIKIPQIGMYPDKYSPPIYKIYKNIEQRQISSVSFSIQLSKLTKIIEFTKNLLRIDKTTKIFFTCNSTLLNSPYLKVSLWKTKARPSQNYFFSY